MVRPLASILALAGAVSSARAGEATAPGVQGSASDEGRATSGPAARSSDSDCARARAETREPDRARGRGPVRRPDATRSGAFGGPFASSRLFAMPTADVIGAYVLSLSGDASLLQETGLLSSAGVFAIGFGDIAQLEYRHTSAISVDSVHAPLPSVGVQLQVPLPERSWIPALGVAFRLGVPRDQVFGDTTVTETVTDLYLVGRLRFDAAPWLRLHGGARISSARIELSGARTFAGEPETLVLPTAGYEVAMNPTATIVGELALVPQFRWSPGTSDDPTIDHGLLGRLGLRWAVLPSVILDGSIGYQLEVARSAPADGLGAVVQWDIRLGAEVFVPWGALACRAVGVFCE